MNDLKNEQFIQELNNADFRNIEFKYPDSIEQNPEKLYIIKKINPIIFQISKVFKNELKKRLKIRKDSLENLVVLFTSLFLELLEKFDNKILRNSPVSNNEVKFQLSSAFQKDLKSPFIENLYNLFFDISKYIFIKKKSLITMYNYQLQNLISGGNYSHRSLPSYY